MGLGGVRKPCAVSRVGGEKSPWELPLQSVSLGPSLEWMGKESHYLRSHTPQRV